MRLLPVFLVIVSLGGCSRSAPDYRAPRAGEMVSPFTIRLDPDALGEGQARADARRALYRGDKSLLAADPRAPIPGAPVGWKEENWRFGVKTIEDIVGEPRDPGHAAFQARALRYAAAYNRSILAETPDWPYRRRTFDPVKRSLADTDDPVRPNDCQGLAHFRFDGLNPRYAASSAREQFADRPVLIGVWGYSVDFPGASREDAQRLGCVIIDGTSDNHMGDGGFNAAAVNYAEAWNVEMLRLTTG